MIWQQLGRVSSREGGRVFDAGFVMAGLVPAIHVLLRDCLEEIVPIRICSDNHSDLPRARPMFDVVLALNGVSDIVKNLKVNEPLQPMPFGKTFDEAGAMLEDATD
jgi:hypothetical protein